MMYSKQRGTISTRSRLWLAVPCVVLFLYLVVSRFAWRAPSVLAEIPAEAALSQDLTCTVQLKALHGNFDVASVRFYVDFYASTAKGPKGLFNPVMVYEQRPRSILSAWSMDLFTYPHSLEFPVTVPFRDFAQQGLLGPGTLTGKLDVNYVSCQPSPGKSMPGVDRMRPGTQSVPFTITIRP